MSTMRAAMGLGPSPAPSTGSGDEWREHAACRDADPTLFHPDGERGEHKAWRENQALSWCRRCPVTTACLADNLDYAVNGAHPGAAEFGIVGGLTEEQRLPLIRKARKSDRRPRVATCGTESGYRTHRARGEDPCEPCRIASADAQRERRTANRTNCSSPGCPNVARSHGMCRTHYIQSQVAS